MTKFVRIVLPFLMTPLALAADPIVVTGPGQNSIDLKLPTGGLARAPGVANIQIFRASRSSPLFGEKVGWTYNHHVDMAAWKGRLYVGWDSCEKDEDVWPSRELYATSSDGVKWSEPAELFPMGVTTALRMYFFHAPNGRMLTIAGLRTSRDDIKEIHKGGLVVREIRDDHALGPVYTLRPPNAPTDSPRPAKFEESTDKGFLEACNQLLANKPFLEQQDYGSLLGERKMKWHDSSTWPADEPSRPHFEKRFGKAMSFFHRKDGALVAVMKWGWVLVSRDEGETWSSPVRPPTLVAGMAKTWGQRTADDRFALLYNPDLAERFPLVQVTGDDGITFGDMCVVHGELPPMRYGGIYKGLGPQYVRGISEWASDGSWKDRATWVAYSMSKEDIWVSRIPLTKESAPPIWNTYAPKWAAVAVKDDVVHLEDRDPADYARAICLLPNGSKMKLPFEVLIDEPAHQSFIVEVKAPREKTLTELRFSPDGKVQTGDEKEIGNYTIGKWHRVRLNVDCENKTCSISMDGQQLVEAKPLMSDGETIRELSFRSSTRPTAPIQTDEDRPTPAARYRVRLVHEN